MRYSGAPPPPLPLSAPECFFGCCPSPVPPSKSEPRPPPPPPPLRKTEQQAALSSPAVLSRSMSDVWREGLRKVGGRFQREGGRRERFLRETSESQLFSAAPLSGLSKTASGGGHAWRIPPPSPRRRRRRRRGGEGREGRERWRTLLPRMKKKKSGPTKALFFLPPPFYSAPAHLAIYSKRMEEGGGSTKATSED